MGTKKETEKESDYLLQNLDFVFQTHKINSLMLMVTYNCQMECSYCKVAIKKSVMKEDVYKKAVRLLFSSESDNLLLRFFGGEPLLYPKLVFDIINYSEVIKKDYPNKKIRYVITTNGFNLNKELIKRLSRFNVEIMISIDGDLKTMSRYRKIRGGNHNYGIILKNLNIIKKTGLNYFVNMLITPLNVSALLDNFEYLVKQGITRIQICYECGRLWKRQDIFRLMEELEKIKKRAEEKSIFFMNLQNKCEPVILSDEIIVDVDGRIFFDIAIFLERSFPQLRKSMQISDVFTAKNLQELFHTKKQIYCKLNTSLSGKERKILSNNIILGLIIKEFIETKLNIGDNKTESIKIHQLISGNVSEQIGFKKENSINFYPYVLHISNTCKNNCIFCKNKSVPNSSLELIDYKLKSNLVNNIEKICIVGNEPLNHPKIVEILSMCKKYGFKEIEMLTSAMFLTDIAKIKELYNMGVNSFSILICSLKSKKHDGIVQRKGDFKDLMKSIRILKSFKKIKIYMHTNVLKQNIDEISNIEGYVQRNITSNFCVLPIRCKTSNLPYEELTPSYGEMIQRLKLNSLVGFPLCVLKKMQDNILLDSSKISDSMKIYLLDQNFVKPKKCASCCLKNKCVGTFKEYIKIYGDKELEPMNYTRAKARGIS